MRDCRGRVSPLRLPQVRQGFSDRYKITRRDRCCPGRRRLHPIRMYCVYTYYIYIIYVYISI